MSRPINTGIIGFGLSGKVFHAPFIHTHPGFTLSAVVERSTTHSRKIYPEVDVVKTHQELLADKSIDLIVVATPNIYHFPMTKEALEAGKHVIIEKPFTPTSREADLLIGLARETGKEIFVFQNRRWDGDFLTIKKLIDNHRLGEIRYYEAHFDRYSPGVKPGAWRDENIPGSGILYDLGSHLIDQALFLFGMPETVQAEIRAEREGSDVDDCFEVRMVYGDKTILLKAGMMVKTIGPRFIIEGTGGSFSKWGIDPQESVLKAGEMPVGDHWGDDSPEFYGTLNRGMAPPFDSSKIPTEKGNYMAFYDNVYHVLLKNKPVSISPEDARDVIFIIEKAFESNMTGRAIKTK